MNLARFLRALQMALVLWVPSSTCSGVAQVELWLTDPRGTARFERQRPLAFAASHVTQTAIDLDDGQRFQTIDGFGFCLTGGSATHLQHMTAGARAALLKDVFSSEGNGIGSSYLRVTIGASDLNQHVYSYDDLPPGETDPDLKKFDL